MTVTGLEPITTINIQPFPNLVSLRGWLNVGLQTRSSCGFQFHLVCVNFQMSGLFLARSSFKRKCDIIKTHTLNAPEHGHVFSKYSRNLNISGLFLVCYTKNNFSTIFAKYEKPHFLTSFKI